MCESFTDFVRFSPKHIVFLVNVINGIVLKVQFPVVPCHRVETQWVVFFFFFFFFFFSLLLAAPGRSCGV